jgi:hypothetical protein
MITAAMLQQFCANDEMRPAIQHPYIRNGDTFATDGRIAIRVRGCVPDVTVDETAPNAAAVIDPLPNDWPWLAIALPDGAGEDRPCHVCNGDVARECEACKGIGEVDWTFNAYHMTAECPVCHGEGRGCDSCDVTGIEHDETPIKIGVNYYKAWYLRLLLALPGPVELCEGGPLEPARIRFNGGDGGIMPVDMDVWHDREKAIGRDGK